MTSKKLLYNSRVFNNYIQYIKKTHPSVQIDQLLAKAEMSAAQIADHGCWFSQRQADLFQKNAIKLTGDPDISRNAGRFSASSGAMGFLRTNTLGLLYPLHIYMSLQRLYKNMSHGSNLKTIKLARNKVEVIARTKPDTPEKEYQCKNRLGSLESIPLILSGDYAQVEHPECMHSGSDQCRYIVTWKDSPSIHLKLLRNHTTIWGLITVILFWILASTGIATMASAIISGCFLLITLASLLTENKELKSIIQDQGDAAGILVEEMNTKYQHAMLLEGIARMVTDIKEPKELKNRLMQLLADKLDFDRGLLLLWDKERRYMEYGANFNYTKPEIRRLKAIRLGSETINGNLFFKTILSEKKPVIISRNEIYGFTTRMKKLFESFKMKNAICAPLVFEDRTLGLLVVDLLSDRRVFVQSDLSLLTAVSSQFALSIANVTSFNKLTASEKRYRNLFENIPLGILTCDSSGNIHDFNPMLVNILRFESGEHLKNINLFSDRWFSQAGIAADILDCFKTKQPAVYEKKIKISTYEIVHVRYHIDPMIDSDNHAYQIQAIFEDITEKKQMESHLQQSQKMESIGTLAGGIAHDFNNILTSIIGYTELAVANITRKASVLTKLNQVLLAANRARDLINQILTFSRETDLEFKPVQINLIIKEVLKMIRATIPRGITIKFDPGNDVMVLGDPTKIHQIIMNLCTNSIQAMESRGSLLNIQLKEIMLTDPESEGIPEMELGPYVIISIEDDGAGINPQIIDRIFEPFFTTKKRGKGTGMGLAVVHGIVRSLEGDVTVNSTPGKGTRFDIYLPRIEKILTYQPDDLQKLPAGSEHILLVMSENEFANLYNEMLTKLGYGVTTVKQPQEGIIRVRHKDQDYNLAIIDIDINHPDIDTYLKSLKDDSNGMPVILCGPARRKKSDIKMRKLGISAYLSKPHTLEQLANCIRDVLD